jgi:hypothetical protein
MTAEARYERKFVLRDVPEATVAAWVRQHPALFSEEFPGRLVNNLYFDTPALRRYREHVAGLSHRDKLRLRWYGELFGAVRAPQLELKRREGARSHKHIVAAPAFTLRAAADTGAMVSGLHESALPPLFRPALDESEPVLLNRYHRRYFRSADRRIRLTLDAEMDFLGCCQRRNSFLASAPACGLVVLELKFAEADTARAAEVAGAFPLRAERMSKYVLGVQLLRAA